MMTNITLEMEARLTEMLKTQADARLAADVAWASHRAAIANAKASSWRHDPNALDTAEKARNADRAYGNATMAVVSFRREIRAAG